MQAVMHGMPSHRVRDVMDDRPRTITADTHLLTIAHLFLTQKLRRLPVLEGTRLVGQISRKDLLAPRQPGLQDVAQPQGRRALPVGLLRHDPAGVGTSATRGMDSTGPPRVPSGVPPARTADVPICVPVPDSLAARRLQRSGRAGGRAPLASRQAAAHRRLPRGGGRRRLRGRRRRPRGRPGGRARGAGSSEDALREAERLLSPTPCPPTADPLLDHGTLGTAIPENDFDDLTPDDEETVELDYEVAFRARYVSVPQGFMDIWFTAPSTRGGSCRRRPPLPAGGRVRVQLTVQKKRTEGIFYLDLAQGFLREGFWDDREDGALIFQDGDWLKPDRFVGALVLGANGAYVAPIVQLGQTKGRFAMDFEVGGGLDSPCSSAASTSGASTR